MADNIVRIDHGDGKVYEMNEDDALDLLTRCRDKVAFLSVVIPKMEFEGWTKSSAVASGMTFNLTDLWDDLQAVYEVLAEVQKARESKEA